MNKLILLIAASALALATTAQASMQKVHWKTNGDNQIALDSDTGIEWLGLNNTKGMSYNQVSAQLGVGGQFAGWRFPTEAEVLAMTTKMYGSTVGQTAANTHYDTLDWRLPKNDYRQVAASNFHSMLGNTYYVTGYNQYGYNYQYASYGAHVNNNPGVGTQSGNFLFSGVYFYHSINSQDSMRLYSGFNLGSSWNDNSTNSLTGWYLVNDGGLSFSSKTDPNLNAANPNAPIRQKPNGTSTLGEILVGTDYASITLGYSNTGTSVTQDGFKYRVNGGAEQTSVGNSILLSNLNAGQTYSIDYAAYNANGVGTWQNTTVTTAAPPPPVAVSTPSAIGLAGLLLVLGLRRQRKHLAL